MPQIEDTVYAIGLMSGTSLDGLDIAYCKFWRTSGVWQYDLLRTHSIAYTKSLTQQLQYAINLPEDALMALHHNYGLWLGETVYDFIATHQLKVDLIASHGHTVFHQPEKGITLQIGSGQVIANSTGITVVSDFRAQDVALGGQGAPLVPVGDELLFGTFAACINLGGIANISYRKDGQRIAYDIGMANMPLNYLAGLRSLPHDENGTLAKSGIANKELLARLNRLSYFKKQPPKSLGVEWFLAEMKPLIDNYSLSIEDKLATLVEHEAQQIAAGCVAIEQENGMILITGGGTFNTFLVERIKAHLPHSLELHIPSQELINFKEALVFAFLGVLRVNNEVNCLRSVTGAVRDSSSGTVSMPKSL